MGVRGRRAFLSGCAALGAAVAGCTTGSENTPELDVLVRNYSSETFELAVDVFEETGDSWDEALVLSDEYTLEAGTETEPTRVEQIGVLPSRPYIVRTAIGGYHHPDFHFYPACAGESGHDRLYIAIDGYRPDHGSWQVVLSQSGSCRPENDR